MTLPGNLWVGRTENDTWWKFWDSECCIKPQLIFIDIMFGSFAKFRSYLALEPMATSMDVPQRFLLLAVSSFIFILYLANIKIWAQKTENELLIFQYCLNLRLNWRSVYVFLSKTDFCYSLSLSDTKLSSRRRAQILFRQWIEEHTTQHLQTKEHCSMEKKKSRVIGLDVKSFKEAGAMGGREKECEEETERKGEKDRWMCICHQKATNKLSQEKVDGCLFPSVLFTLSLKDVQPRILPNTVISSFCE